MGLKEELLSRSDRKEYNPKTKTGWKKVKGKWTYFENGKEKGTGLGDALWNLPGQIRDYNRKANDQDRSTEPWYQQNKPQKVKPEEQYTTGVGPGIKRFGPEAEADKANVYQSLNEELESQKQDKESRNYSLWLQNKIANSKDEREKARWTTQYFELVGSDNADIISEEVGGDDNYIQPRTWEEPEGQVSDQPSEGADFRQMFDIPETEGGQVQQTIQDGKPLAEDEYQEWDTGMDVNKGVIGKIGDKNWTKDSDKNIGSTPWARKSLMDSPKLANQATWRLLEEEGYDLRGLGLSDKQDLARDYRLDRLNKTDKGMFFRNRFMRKR